ncbi:MAG: CotH kinase family protein [Labilithrix sp.]
MSSTFPAPKALLLLIASMTSIACAPAAEEEVASSEGELAAADEAPTVLFNLNDVKSVELNLDPAAMDAMTNEAHAAAVDRELLWAPRTKARGTFKVNLAPGVTTSCDTSKPVAVTVKIKGMWSMQGFDQKPSLKIDFDKNFCGLKNLALNNMVQDTSFVNEALAYKMYESMGVPAPRYGYSNVSVNGAPLGLYLSLEAIDKKFLARQFGDGTGELYEGTYGGDLRDGDIGTRVLAFTGEDDSPEANGFPQMRAFVAAVNQPGDGVFYGPSAMVDTAEFVSMMATAFVIGDWDNYVTANNYRFYRNPKTNLWSIIPTGTDQTFSSRLHPMNAGRAPSVLFGKCLESPRCSADYMAAVGRAVQKLQEPEGTLVGTAQRRLELVKDAIHADTRRTQNDEQAFAAFLGLAQFITDRPAEIAAMMSLPGAPGGCGALGINEGLVPGRRVTSCDGRFVLVMQPTDGNIVLYRNDGVPVWAAATPGTTTSLFVQGDGNVVAYDTNRNPVWTTSTDGHPGAFLAVQDDGNLVIYEGGNAIWASNTAE